MGAKSLYRGIFKIVKAWEGKKEVEKEQAAIKKTQ
jgi:hypothetical protein